MLPNVPNAAVTASMKLGFQQQSNHTCGWLNPQQSRLRLGKLPVSERWRAKSGWWRCTLTANSLSIGGEILLQLSKWKYIFNALFSYFSQEKENDEEVTYSVSPWDWSWYGTIFHPPHPMHPHCHAFRIFSSGNSPSFVPPADLLIGDLLINGFSLLRISHAHTQSFESNW